jgi:1,4-alpha-glucan branching enzyme
VLDAIRADASEAATPSGARVLAWRHRSAPRVWAGLAAAACLAAAAFAGGAVVRWQTAREARPDVASASPSAARADTVWMVRFVFVAPDAKRVALVGDFNAWDREAVHLSRSDSAGVWTTTVALPAGRHEYAFLIDGVRWAADPNARSTVRDEFGVQSSVVLVDTSTEETGRRT